MLFFQIIQEFSPSHWRGESLSFQYFYQNIWIPPSDLNNNVIYITIQLPFPATTENLYSFECHYPKKNPESTLWENKYSYWWNNPASFTAHKRIFFWVQNHKKNSLPTSFHSVFYQQKKSVSRQRLFGHWTQVQWTMEPLGNSIMTRL